MTPGHAPGANFLHHCILLFITFNFTWNMTMFVQNVFWTLRGHTPWPCPQGSHQNSECVPPVLIYWAITCDSFKVLTKKPKRSWVTLKTSDPKSYFLTSNDPRHAPGANVLHYCILLLITFNLICNMTTFVQNGFWTLRGHTAPALPLGATSKFRMCSSSPHP